MDNLSTQFFDLTPLQDEPIDPQLMQGAMKRYNSSPIRVKKQSKASENDIYKVLSSDEIVQYVVSFVEEVNSIVQLSSTITRMLLSHCKWDPNHLTENFYNDPEKLFKEARVINPFNVSLMDKIVEENNECKICFGEVSSCKTATIACGHKFCTACWAEYLKIKIMDEGVGNSILCPESDCDVIIDDETVIELVNNLQVKHRYQHFITNSFVQQNPLLRWCPAAGCSFVIKVDYSPIKPISCNCKCGHEFCFDCGDVSHSPIPCALLKRFNDQLRERVFHPQLMLREDEFYGYSDVIKTCPNPNCSVSIQKVVGCHVMQCKNCSTNFCWNCLNRYKTKAAVYCHMCPGDEKVKSDDAPKKEAEAKKENRDEDMELAPPKKCVKLSIHEAFVSTLARTENGQKEATSNDREQSSQRKANENDALPEGDANQRMQGELDPDGREGEGVEDRRTLDIVPPMRHNFLRFGPPRHRLYANPYHAHRQYSYYNKYNAEDEKYKAAVTQSTQIKQALQYIREKSEKLVQIELAAILLVQSRQTLKYSALFAMYLDNIDKSLLFSNLYQDLEAASTTLANSMLYVSVHMPESHEHISESVIPAQRNCRLRRRALLDYIDEGYDNGLWSFTDRPTN